MFALSIWLMLDNHAGRSRRHSAVILQWDWGGKQSRPGRAHAVSVMSGNHERMADAFIREEHVRNESTSEATLAHAAPSQYTMMCRDLVSLSGTSVNR